MLAACGFDRTLSSPIDAPVDAPIDAPEVPACFQTRCLRRAIKTDHTKVTGGPHAQFPLFVQITEPQLDASLAFVFNNTLLPHERERFANGQLTAWVAIPSLSSTADTTIYLYFGNVNAGDTQNRTAVWDANFEAVWHLGETLGGINMIKDSTANVHAGTDVNSPMLNVAGKLLGGVRLDGIDDHIRIPQSPALTAIGDTGTLSLWINWVQAVGTDYQRILLDDNSIIGDGSGMEWATNMMGYYYYYPSLAGGNNYGAMPTPFVNGTWHHIAITQDYATKTLQMFVDGTSRTSGFTGTSWTKVPTGANWYWGGLPPRTKLAGTLDEIHVSKTVRTPEWIATEYANQNSPTTFYSVSGE